ncbi:MAG TPA: hypothetical protein VJP85_15375 [Candidatus Baltobacteraceae bacterium]|nr:hypothetical protein [Candidatus Baltobacteraceae bacterium]
MTAAQADAQARYVAWFHELDAWTEYWDVYHPESNGRYYFGNGRDEKGLLTKLLPNQSRPPVFGAWCRMALGSGSADGFLQELAAQDAREAIFEIDDLVARLFAKHFGDAADAAVRSDYLEGIFRFATDALPPAAERDARIDASDPRKATAGRHTLDSDIMWFAWAFELEAAHVLARGGGTQPRHALLMAGVATGCAANFTWRGHRRTRAEYRADAVTRALLLERGAQLASDFEAAAHEVHALFRIREWGHE